MANYTIAVATTDITPGPDTAESPWMGGYGWDPRGNFGYSAARPLQARCLAIGDGKTRVLMLRLDVVSVPDEIYEQVLDRISDLTDDDHFMLLSSHTHSGPALPGQPDPYVIFNLSPNQIAQVESYGEYLVDALASVVREAAEADPTPVNLTYMQGSASVAVNRCGLDITVDEVPVLLAEAADSGDPVAVLFGYACHPVARGNDTVYDSDFPGYASQLIEDELHCPAFFGQGTAGDRNPDTDGGDAAVADVGSRLAAAVLDTVQRRDNAVAVTGEIQATLQTVDLPLVRDLTDPGEKAELRQYFQDLLNRIRPTDPPGARFCEVMIRRLDDDDFPAHMPLPVQCWKFGTGLAILALGGEVLSNYDLIARTLTTRPLWVLAYANRIPAYIPGDNILWHEAPFPTYESGWIDDPNVAGLETSLMSYGWPCPLQASIPEGTDPAAPDSAEGTLTEFCRKLLQD